MSNLKPSKYIDLQPFQAWVQQSLPAVYDDSLSYTDLLAKMLAYLNNLVANNNTLSTDVTNAINYINTFFESTDFQDKVDDKLNRMAEDGSLSELIQPLFDAYKAQIDSTVATQNTSISNIQSEQNVLKQRMDTFTSLPSGSTSGDAELNDIRVGANGVTYSTAGDAVRGQYNQLKEDLVELDLIATEQDFVINNGKYINADTLKIEDSPNYGYTNPYFLKKGNKVIISTKGAGTSLGVINLCDKTNDKRINLVYSTDSDKHTYTYVAPVDMYVIFSFTTDDYSISICKQDINDSKVVEKSILGYNSPIQIEKVQNMIFQNSYRDHTNYVCSKPIKLLKGQKIETNMRCEEVVSAISKVQEDGTILQSLVMGVSNAYLPYEYIADEDCYIVVCFYVKFDSNNEFNGITYYPAYDNLERIYYNSIDRMSFSMFENFGVIGDSFASGVFFDKAENKLDNHLNKSWGQILARKSGNICTNFSKGGLYCGDWLTDTDRGLPYLLQENAKELYIIALGINDVSKLSNVQPLGTIADINTDFSQNPNSFYGNYGRIIGNVKQHAPNSKIIITTIPYTGEGAMKINNAIVDIAQHYDLPCLKLHTNTFFQSAYFWNNMYDNHPKSFMYGAMANEYENMICNDIKVNTSYWGDTFN